MSKFKVGELIQCVDASQASGLSVGKTYQVLDLDEENDPYVESDCGSSYPYASFRFELAESEKEPETFQYHGKIYRRATPEDSGKLGIMCDYDISDAATAANEPYVSKGEMTYNGKDDFCWQKKTTKSVWKFAYVEVDQKPAEPTVYERVTSRIERSTLIYNYLDAQAAFERASNAYNEACQAIRDNVKDGEKFVYTRYGEGYIVSRDKDGFTVDKIDMV